MKTSPLISPGPSGSSSSSDALLSAQSEIRDLQATIAEMRVELEARERRAAERVEAVRSRYDAEIRDLQATIVKLRHELDDAMARTRERVSDQTQVYRETIEHHMQTIRALRERLDSVSSSGPQ